MSNLDVLVLVKDFFSLERRLIGLDLTPTGGSLYEDHMSMVKVLLMFFFLVSGLTQYLIKLIFIYDEENMR